ncbi:MAG: DUF1566 domain-containing protein [Prolixibacteraceae bacterium]|nr:DUF1566 domain-containing protein [Prolixibacteraceae bacterium]
MKHVSIFLTACLFSLIGFSQDGNKSYPIVDTGQELFFDNSKTINEPSKGEAFFGQDAGFDGNLPSYNISSDGLTIYDNVTGLTWTKSPDLNHDGEINSEDKMYYSDFLSYADVLNEQNFGGFNDWRAPTIKELYSLMDFRGTDPIPTGSSTNGLIPYIDTGYFDFGYGDMDAGERIIDAQFWSVNKYTGTVFNGVEAVFGLNLADGRIKGYPSSGSRPKTNYVYFVRGNTDYGVNDFKDNEDGTITDFATGLMWSQEDSKNGMDWEDALAWVEQKNAQEYLGFSDWRLPNAKELQSIVDYSRSPDYTNSPAIDPVFNCTGITNEAGDSDYPFYWTGTTHKRFDGSGYAAVYVAFGRGLGSMDWWNVIDVHGAGCQRSDPKEGNENDYPSWGHGPQGDVQRVFNFVRLVRNADENTTDNNDNEDNEGDDNENNTGESLSATLFAPIGQTTTYLIDENGNNINTWESSQGPALSAYLLNDSTLLRTTCEGRNSNSVFKAGGAGGKVEQYDWDGNLIWEFTYNSNNYLLHHDIEKLPNGNILMIAWEYKSRSEAIAAGRNPNLLSEGELWPDKIIEVEPTGSSGGNIVWEWKVWDHLIQDYDNSKSNYGVVSQHPEKININFVDNQAVADWIHLNAIDYNEELDQIMVTSRNFSEIWIINHNTTSAEASGNAGDLLYRWGNPQTYGRGTGSDQKLFGCHDGQWITKGLPGENDILVFNNGRGRNDGNYSSVDQFTPPLNNSIYTIGNNAAFGPESLIWTYTSTPTTEFFADHISGAQRLPDGNTLVCSGTNGAFFEITSEGEVVWQYESPYTFTNPQGHETNEVFRAVRYYLSVPEETEGENEIDETGKLFVTCDCYPNPFIHSTVFRYSLTIGADVELSIYTMQGRKVTTLVSQFERAGYHQAPWNGTFRNGLRLRPGIYVYQMIAGSEMVTGKVVIQR